MHRRGRLLKDVRHQRHAREKDNEGQMNAYPTEFKLEKVPAGGSPLALRDKKS